MKAGETVSDRLPFVIQECRQRQKPFIWVCGIFLCWWGQGTENEEQRELLEGAPFCIIKKRKGKPMEIVMRKTSEVKPYGKNPRRNDGAVDAVAASIREFGFKQPIVVDTDGVIIVGHTRFKAAKKLGLKEVPVCVADDLSPEKVKAYRLADNKTGELAGWDFSMLDMELAELDIDLSEFGFTQQEEQFDADAFFKDAEPSEKKAKEYKCPHCGMYFTP